MPRLLTAAFAMVLLASGATLLAQMPNFSGTWEIDPARSNLTDGTATTLTITQSPTEFAIDRQFAGDTDHTVYVFKSAAEVLEEEPVGTSGKTAVTGTVADGPGGPTTVQASGAEWRDGGLETTTVLMISGKPVMLRTRRTLNSAGTEMTVERLLAVQHGYSSGEASATAREVYVRR